jgi:hypothetical protein
MLPTGRAVIEVLLGAIRVTAMIMLVIVAAFF